MKFSDPIDQGAHLAAIHTQSSIEHHRLKNQPQQKQVWVDDGNGGQVLAWEHTECVDCGDDIEPERLAMARIRCVSCQTLFEEKEKKYGRF